MSAISEEDLNRKRFECDPLADNAMAEVARVRGEKAIKGHYVLRAVQDLGRLSGDSHCARFIEFYEQEPPWEVDWQMWELGRRVFVRNSVFAGLVLMYGSLVSSFTAAYGNKVLSATGRISPNGDVRRRLFETLFFVRAVVLGSSSEIKEACMRVRLLHAAVRRHLLHRDGGWEIENFGCPINQEDLAGTLSTFSSVVVDGLEILGVSLSKTEKDAYQTLWKYVGFYLGMTSDLLCDNYEEEWKLCNMIRVRQCKPDPDSVVLTEALLQEFASKNPFYLGYNFSSSLSRHFIGDDLADELGLSRFNMLSQVIMNLLYWILRTSCFTQRRVSFLEHGLYKFGKYALNTIVHLSLGGREPSFIMKVYS